MNYGRGENLHRRCVGFF